jgi:hypothetical protein
MQGAYGFHRLVMERVGQSSVNRHFLYRYRISQKSSGFTARLGEEDRPREQNEQETIPESLHKV